VSATASPTRVALVGCGAVAWLYYSPALRALSAEGLLQVVALVDPDAESLHRFGSHFPQARCLPDVSGLSDCAVELAIVASPPRFHASQTIDLLGRGISILCEKPMAATVAEAESMIEAADSARRLLAVGLVRRFLPAARAIKGILARGALGDVESFHFKEGGRFRWPTRSANYFHPAAAIGGVLWDIGAHVLDLTVWWMGEPSEVRYADDAMGGVDANCRIELEFSEGFRGVVRLSRDTDLPSRCFIQGSRGWLLWSIEEPDELSLSLDGMASVVSGRLYEASDLPSMPGTGRRVMNFEQSFVAQIRNVVASVRDGDRAFVTGLDALPGVRLIEACRRRRTLMPMGWLDEREQVRARALSGDRSGR